MSSQRPFFGKAIVRREEQEYISRLVDKYRDETANEALRRKVYEELMWEKHLGHITIPFKVILHEDAEHPERSYLEVVLDTKV